MSDQQKLHYAMSGTEWHEAAQEMLASGWEFKDQTDYYAEVLTDRVLDDECTLKQLRLGLRWVNALDAEATRLSSSINSDTDRTEALARRIANHAGRSALQSIGTNRKLNTERARRSAVSKKYAL